MTYLDSAATTLQKPASVERAMTHALTHMASPGRGGHAPAMLAADTAFACREAAAELFHMDDPANVVFTLNATHALNLAIKSVVKPGDTVVVSGYEHNAVTRPLTALGCRILVARSPLFEPQAILEQFDRLITGDVACVVCTYVSNVFGYILPVEEIAALCRSRGVPFILDASQGAGALPVHMDRLGCAFVGMPGHKGLYGPQGTGVLLCREDMAGKTLLEGGTGSVSIQQEMPAFLPDRLEAGTHNMPGIAGLMAGVRYVRGRGLDKILDRERRLVRLAASELKRIPGLLVYAAPNGDHPSGVLSVIPEGQDAEQLGAALAERNIAVRAGLHCAPLAHRSAGTLDTGTVRISVSDFNTPEEIHRLAAAVGSIAGGS